MQDFEEAAKKSWQSFSTMKRFVSEANRLENASWRLWFMQKSRLQDGAAPLASSNAPPPRLRVLCVYCEMHHASLSCHGCCHDAYCVSCFKLIHKKGHLATHTAVKLCESIAATTDRRVTLTDAPTAPGAKSMPSHRPQQQQQPPQQQPRRKSPTLSPVSSSSSSTESSPRESISRNGWTNDVSGAPGDCKLKHHERPGTAGRRDRVHKSWENQMDTLLQRLMANSIHHESDISLSVIKVADFGMAAFIESDGKLKGRCGTPGFVAPEILTAGKGESYPSGVDMFSAGVVVYTMLCGYEPFFGVNDEELIQMNKLVEYEFEEPEWSSISDEAKDLPAL
ncbi:hypothetical protein P43SY_007787 [Pythium insidiosum]|uniref:Protein kinase domain-containing protein n=1 Tax=Pythium insidiosum TaxID=114742 RepID=A0AAD5M2A7_PYTIN|nr:hypothetical protein P43SY_007787 [Pythium insidiosum]